MCRLPVSYFSAPALGTELYLGADVEARLAEKHAINGHKLLVAVRFGTTAICEINARFIGKIGSWER